MAGWLALCGRHGSLGARVAAPACSPNVVRLTLKLLSDFSISLDKVGELAVGGQQAPEAPLLSSEPLLVSQPVLICCVRGGTGAQGTQN
jgi:hypothetical protein